MEGTVEAIVHGARSVFMKFHMSGSRMFHWEHVKLDTRNEFTYSEEAEE